MSETSSSEETIQLDAKDREAVLAAGEAWERRDYEEGVRLLSSQLSPARQEVAGIVLNRSLCAFHAKKLAGNKKDIATLVSCLRAIPLDKLSPEQALISDYNQALALARDGGRYRDAIDILEKRRKIVSEFNLSNNVDQKLVTQLNFLLAIVYLESRKYPSQALSILNSLTDKLAGGPDDKQGPSSHGHHFIIDPTRLQQLKVRCLLQMGKSKEAKKELKKDGDPIIRSHYELLRENPKKAFKILATCPDTESIQYKNNEALLLYGSGKKNTAIFKLTELLTQSLSQECSIDVVYNLAVMHLMTGNADGAKALLKELIPVLKFNARMWFRFGEAILFDRTKDFLKDWDILRHRQELLKCFSTGISSGDNGQSRRKKILNNLKCRSIDAKTLTAARSCFMNALHVINDEDPSASLSIFYPSTLSSESELIRFKIALFLSLSFVNLALDDYAAAADFAKSALNLQPKGYQRVLGSIYNGHALVGLDKGTDALQFFNADIVKEEMSVPISEDAPPPVHDAVSSWYPGTARVVLHYNQAVTLTSKGEYERAVDVLKPLLPPSGEKSSVIPVQVTQLALFLYLKLGMFDAARHLILQYMPKYWPQFVHVCVCVIDLSIVVLHS